jgi:hypothetical protein
MFARSPDRGGEAIGTRPLIVAASAVPSRAGTPQIRRIWSWPAAEPPPPPELSRHLIYVPRYDLQGRMGVVRAVIHHLAEGGAVLIFPGGNIEPDPAVLPGAPDALGSWSHSLDVVLRRVPQAQVVVSIVSGVLTRAALRNPLSPFLRSRRDRQKVAEIVQVGLQLLLRTPLGLSPWVTFTRLPADEPRETRMTQLLGAARRQIDEHTSRWEKPPVHRRPIAA